MPRPVQHRRELLFTGLLLRQYAQAFRAALLHSRARESTVEVEDVAEASARFVARWSS